MDWPATPRRRLTVAVIGAGVSGLVAARELRREGHDVVVFEKSDCVGGNWVYTPLTESDPLGLDPSRGVVHSSLYRSLRTNLPRPLMSFLDFSFADNCYGDPRPFPAHGEVLAFLEHFAEEFGILEVVRLGAEVVRIEMGPGGTKEEWVVEWRRVGEESAATKVETFDAVVVCNGHFAQPKITKIPGIQRWRGKQIHSHNYRIPEPFQDMVVVLMGDGPSAYDISRDIAKVAKEVHLTSSPIDVQIRKLNSYDNIWQHAKIKCVNEDGKVEFYDGSSVSADVIFHCTGYKYQFSFFKQNDIVSVDDNRVGPLYKHVFPPNLAPGISFVGLGNKSIIFLTLELQSKWIAQVLSGKVSLPSEEDMNSHVKDFYAELEQFHIPKRHSQDLYPNEDKYMKWLVGEIQMPPLEEWMVKMYRTVMMKRQTHDEDLRNRWDPENWE